jgi:hypothetical protein
MLATILYGARDVRCEEVSEPKIQPDYELARTHRLDRAADLFDDAAIFMAHDHGRLDIVQAAEGPEIGPADAGGR